MCGECYGISGCPICTPEPIMVECYECKGAGKYYYNGDGDEITEAAYMSCTDEDKCAIECDECKGAGEIEVEND